MSIIHHVSVGTNDLARAARFYDAVLAGLGLVRIALDAQAADYGTPDLVFSVETPVDGHAASVGNGSHVAFTARDRAAVNEFHRVALEVGGSDAGAPGPRRQYDPDYYAAFILDPDGNKIEAVTYSAE